MTEKLNSYTGEIEREIDRLKLWHCDYPVPTLLVTHSRVCQLLAGTKRRISRLWDSRTARLAEIVLEEQAHADNVGAWYRQQEMEERRNNPLQGRGKSIGIDGLVQIAAKNPRVCE